jgi:hypothetical protein
MILNNLLPLLKDVEELTEGEYRATCPCPKHPGTKPLSISPGLNESILLKCGGGCKTADVVKALGLEMSDLFTYTRDGNPKKKKRAEPKPDQAKPRPKAIRREYVRVPGYLMVLRQLTGKSPIVLSRILDHMGENDVAWPSQRTLAKECGLSLWSVNGIVARLVRDGLLTVEHSGTVRSDHYAKGPTLLYLEGAWKDTEFPSKARKKLADHGFAGPTYQDAVKGIFDEASERRKHDPEAL